MKKLLLLLTILASVSLTSFAQTHKGEGRRGKNHDFKKELNLSAKQQEKMKSLNEEFKGKFNALKSDESLTKENKREKMKELSNDKKTKIQALLTPEQKTKMNSMHEKKMQASKNDRKKSDKRSGKMRADLNLTDSQKTQMKSLKESFRNEMKSLKENSSLSKEAKDQKRKEMATAHRDQVKSILTPEQQAKMKENFSKDKNDSRKKGKYGDKRERGNRDKSSNMKSKS